MGEVEKGLDVLTEALSAVYAQGERVYESDLHRLKGELLLRRAIPAIKEADACFRQALDVARRQQGKALELRATVSLSRLWRHQGNRAEARRLLKDAYAWFSEGFDRADLQEASALLEELS
jgi:predicted ATPase